MNSNPTMSELFGDPKKFLYEYKIGETYIYNLSVDEYGGRSKVVSAEWISADVFHIILENGVKVSQQFSTRRMR